MRSFIVLKKLRGLVYCLMIFIMMLTMIVCKPLNVHADTQRQNIANSIRDFGIQGNNG
ncbi:MAG: hypothetical protein AB6733_23580 [Clostridiaceae bacterium]